MSRFVSRHTVGFIVRSQLSQQARHKVINRIVGSTFFGPKNIFANGNFLTPENKIDFSKLKSKL
jgi:hypothetical protein